MDCSHLYNITTVRNLVIVDASSIMRMIDYLMPDFSYEQKECLLKVVFTSSEQNAAELLSDAHILINDIYGDELIHRLTSVCMHRDMLLNTHVGDKIVDNVFSQQAANSFVLKILHPSIVYLVIEDYHMVVKNEALMKGLL